MIERKIWNGDVLDLAAGNSFWHNEVVTHRAGICVASKDSEVGDPLVEIDNGAYIVKRSDLSELSERDGKITRIVGQLGIPEALNGIDKTEREVMLSQLQDILDERKL